MRAYFSRKRKMRLNTKGMDARRGAQRMVMRLRPGIAPAQVREQPLSAPFTAERSLMRPSPHQPLRGYRVRGAFARLATPQTPFCVQTLRAGHAVHAWRCYSPLVWNNQTVRLSPSPARTAWPAHLHSLLKQALSRANITVTPKKTSVSATSIIASVEDNPPSVHARTAPSVK